MYLDHTFARKTFAQRNNFTFGLSRYILRPNFRSANWLSESLSQRVKSPIVACCLFHRNHRT